MKFSEYFELDGLTQENLDFLDGLTEQDIPLYIDPAQIEVQEGEWFEHSARILNSFFEHILNLYREGNDREAEVLLVNAHEPNETRLGVSRDTPQGRGSSPEKLIEVFRYMREKALLENGLITNYNDLNIFVKDFAEDRMSDLVTNLLRGKLAEYTIEQSTIYGLELTEEPINIGVEWDLENLRWRDVNRRALMIDGELLLLVPKSIVVQKYLFSVGEFLAKTVFQWRKEYHLNNDTDLVRKKYVKKYDKTISYPPSNDLIVEKEITGQGLSRKEYAINTSRENMDLIRGFRRTIDYTLRGLNSNRLSDEKIMEIVEKRRKEL
ncbi:MAG: hypothetical protein ACQEWU_05270 [Bacillota bacterium]